MGFHVLIGQNIVAHQGEQEIRSGNSTSLSLITRVLPSPLVGVVNWDRSRMKSLPGITLQGQGFQFFFDLSKLTNYGPPD